MTRTIRSCYDTLCKFALIAKTDMVIEYSDGITANLYSLPDDNPVYANSALRGRLRAGAASQEDPFILRDDFDVFFSAIHAQDGYLYIGPMSSQRRSSVHERQFYQFYGMDAADPKPLRFFTLQEILYITEMAAETLIGQSYEEAELLYRNHLTKNTSSSLQESQQLFLLQEDEANEDDATWRHTYREERRLMDAVREGRVEDALQLSRRMDDDSGRLSGNELEHWHNLCVIGIALVARAAIEGGLSPQSAYRISGYYINRCSSLSSVTHLLGIRDYAIRELTARVHEKLQNQHSSSITEACKTYVSRHYRDKISLDEIAQELNISSTWLSKVFRKDTGMRLQDYIIQVRLEKAANLLRYSDRSIAQIAQYVHFPSQSYMGKLFRERMHTTPLEYRNRYQTKEWQKPEE